MPRAFMFRFFLPYHVAPKGAGDKYMEITVTADDEKQALACIGLLPGAQIVGVFETVALIGEY